MFAAAAIRRYSTKRTIPYVAKNNWKLPATSPSIEQSASSLQSADGSWGSMKAASGDPYINVPREWRKMRSLPQWKRQMFALKEKFPQGWDPKRKLSREEMQNLRELKAAQPQLSLNELGSAFRISPEAVRRIIKSRWTPKEAEATKLSERWIRRGVRLDSSRAKQAAERQQAKQQATQQTTQQSAKTTRAKGQSETSQTPRKTSGKRRKPAVKTKHAETPVAERNWRARKLHDPGQDVF